VNWAGRRYPTARATSPTWLELSASRSAARAIRTFSRYERKLVSPASANARWIWRREAAHPEGHRVEREPVRILLPDDPRGLLVERLAAVGGGLALGLDGHLHMIIDGLGKLAPIGTNGRRSACG
jgi:hypothetical protein